MHTEQATKQRVPVHVVWITTVWSCQADWRQELSPNLLRTTAHGFENGKPNSERRERERDNALGNG